VAGRPKARLTLAAGRFMFALVVRFIEFAMNV
jgi:hypothetical protein